MKYLNAVENMILSPMHKISVWRFASKITFIAGIMGVTFPSLSVATADLTSLSLEELINVEITSVGKKEQKSSEVPAAIYVITASDIKHSGSTSIAEMLRMVPGVQVAKLDSNKWSISIRGATGRFSNKLLVLMDGRSVYTPGFSGVYWEVQDTLLDDIERIEIIRGPGATVWGANAVNGVINIITKEASQTQGLLVSAGKGSYEKGFANARYGWQFFDKGAVRIYGKYFLRNNFELDSGSRSFDDWEVSRGGGRFDWQFSEGNTVTLQGDFYGSDINQLTLLPTLVSPNRGALHPESISPRGWNVLTRWHNEVAENKEYNLQIYYDDTVRRELTVGQEHKIFDVDFTYRMMFEWHDLIVGLGYRNIHDYVENSRYVIATPISRDDSLYSGFIQDEISLKKDILNFTVGSKFEHNAFTGMEIQPNARLAWLINSHDTLWGSVSYAVRTPSRVEHDAEVLLFIRPPVSPLPFPIQVPLYGTDSYISETLIAYEAGYRFFDPNNISIDVTAFYNDYKHIHSYETLPLIMQFPKVVSPRLLANKHSGYTYGFELSTDYQLKSDWRISLVYSTILQNFREDLDSVDNTARLFENDSPRQQLSFRSLSQPLENIDIDLWVRYIGSIKHSGLTSDFAQSIPSYITLDVRCAWRPTDYFELALVGKNLIDSSHLEAVSELYTVPTRVSSEYYLQGTINF